MHDRIFSDSPTYTRGFEIATSPPLNKLSVFRTFEVVVRQEHGARWTMGPDRDSPGSR